MTITPTYEAAGERSASWNIEVAHAGQLHGLAHIAARTCGGTPVLTPGRHRGRGAGP